MEHINCKTSTVNICIYCSKEQAAACGVAIASLVMNGQEDRQYNIYILSDEIDEENKRRLEYCCKLKKNITVQILDISDNSDIRNRLNSKGLSFNQHIILGVLSAELPCCDKIVLLNCNSIVSSDVGEIYDMLDDKSALACEDIFMKLHLENDSYFPNRIPAIKTKEYVKEYLGCEQYYNFQICVLNLKKLKDQNALDKYIYYLENKKFWYIEQGIMNLICKDDVQNLPIDWACPIIQNLEKKLKQSNLTKLQLDYVESKNKYRILYYPTRYKPQLSPHCEFSSDFFFYCRQTLWYEEVQDVIAHAKPLKKSNVKEGVPKNKGLTDVLFPKNSARRTFIKKLFPAKSRRRELLVAFLRFDKARIKFILYHLKQTAKTMLIPFLSACPFSSIFRSKKKIKKYKDIHKGKRCFIVGLGPSLAVDDLEKIKGEITFSLNDCYSLFDKTEWRPTYYVNFELLSRFSARFIERFISNQNQYHLKNVFLPYCRYTRKLSKLFKEDNLTFLPVEIDWSNYTKDDRDLRFSRDCSRVVKAAYTTVYAIAQIAVYMGFSEIYFIGADCNYQVGARHCYDSKLEYDFNTKKKCDADTKGVTRGYQKIREATETIPEVKFYNATRGGMLEEFERVDLDHVLKGRDKNEHTICSLQ